MKVASVALVVIALQRQASFSNGLEKEHNLRMSGRKQDRRRLPISSLSDDEFDDQSFFNETWAVNGPVATAAITDGVLTLSPSDAQTSGWYGSAEGLLISQSMGSGNFVVETYVSVSSESEGLPAGNWHSAGIIVRSATALNSYAHINVGRQGPFTQPLTYGTQAMLTVRGDSDFRYEAAPDDVLSGRIRICRVGSELSLLRSLDTDVADIFDPNPWHAVEYDNDGIGVPSFLAPADLQGDVEVGLMMSRWSDAPENVVARYDYVRFAEPSSTDDCFVEDLTSLSGGPTLAPSAAPVTPSPTSSPTPAPVTPDPTAVPETGAPTSAPVTPVPTFSTTTISPTGLPTISGPSIETLSDEFFYNSTFSSWNDVDPSRYTSVSIQDGIFEIVPAPPTITNVWYDQNRGAGFTKAVTGNFVVETLVNVRVNGTDGLPNGDWNVGGVVAQSTTQENDWLVANIGSQGPSGRMSLDRTLGVETKTTDDGTSHFNYSPDLVLANPGLSGTELSARLRICRVGQEFLLLYMLQGLGETSWTAQNPLPAYAPWNGIPGAITSRPDLPETLNVGVMTNHMLDSPGNDGLPSVSRFDYVRYGSVNTLDDCTAPMMVM